MFGDFPIKSSKS